jgi:hypothetical protein
MTRFKGLPKERFTGQVISVGAHKERQGASLRTFTTFQRGLLENMMPKQFDANVLNQLTHAEEINVETQSATGRKHRTTIWVVVEGNEVYVRSVRGRAGRWYREFIANPLGAIDMDGQHIAVQAVPATDGASITRVSNEYLRKYRRSPYVNSIVRQETLPTTLRLEPASPPVSVAKGANNGLCRTYHHFQIRRRRKEYRCNW